MAGFMGWMMLWGVLIFLGVPKFLAARPELREAAYERALRVLKGK